VKLSDNYEKASGPPELIEHYREVFGLAGVAHIPVLV
jgi:nicotinate phosphoribosyltransferase